MPPTPLTITPTQARRARQHSQLLPAAPGRAPADVARWHGAMQSQDYASGLWSLGARCAGSTVEQVQAAFENAEVLRTWPMRGTIHTVASSDTRWLLDLTGSRALQSSTRRREQLGLDLVVADRAAGLLVDALVGRPYLTRREALAVLNESGIETTGQRGYHLLWYAAQTGRTCIGPTVSGEQTFVDLARWAPEQTRLDRADALTELVYRYFASHGPALITDFTGWSGLTLTDARAGIAANDGRLVPATCGDTTFWMSTDTAGLISDGRFRSPAPPLVLPGFDEFVLGFKDRSLQLAPEHFDRIVPGGNGMFRPTVSIDGRVVAAWSRTVSREHVKVDVDPFEPLKPAALPRLERAFDAYARFLGLRLRLTGLATSSP